MSDEEVIEQTPSKEDDDASSDTKDELELSEDVRDIGSEAVWSLSTAKPGNGIDQVRDDNTDTYWQSDGQQPHLVNIQFLKKTSIYEVAFYVSHKLDESYTPKKISIRTGNTYHDLQEVYLLELDEPNGWVRVSLRNEKIRTHLLQAAVISMHQNGRDTHIRQIRILGPRISVTKTKHLPEFETLELSQFSCLR